MMNVNQHGGNGTPQGFANTQGGETGPTLVTSVRADNLSALTCDVAQADDLTMGSADANLVHAHPTLVDGAQIEEVSRPAVVKLPVPANVLDKMSQAMPGMRELARFAGGPRYEAYFIGGKAAQITKAGNLSVVQHDGKKITEVAKLRSLRPGQLANLGFSFLTAAVGMEHMARIDRQLSRLNQKMDEIAAMLVDDLTAPIRDVAASIHRFSDAGSDGVSRETAEAWVRDLRLVRQRLIAKVARVPAEIRPSESFFWSSQVADLKVGASKMVEAGRLIQLLAVTDAFVHKIADSLNLPMALDGVDDADAIRLAGEVEVATAKLMSSTDKDCGYDSTGKRELERREALGTAQDAFREMLNSIKQARNMRILSGRLNDSGREFRVTIEHDRIIALHEVKHEPPRADEGKVAVQGT